MPALRLPRLRPRALRTKLWRDVRRLWAQVLSIALVVACGVMAAVSMRSTHASLGVAMADFYRAQRFGDVFATVQRAPESARDALARIPGVAAVETRVMQRVSLDVPGLEDAASALVVSIPAPARPTLDAPLVHRGRWPRAGTDDEVLASAVFAEANGLVPGATLGIVVNGRWRRVRVVGMATGPDFVFEAAAATMATDNRRFAVLWMPRPALAAAAGLTGAFTDVSLRLSPDASADAVRAAVDRTLAPHGTAGAIPRDEQTSHRVLSDERRQLGVMALVFPLFFVGTSAFLLQVVLSRLVATQRDEIAALKAFGYTDREVGAHYLGFAAVAVALGALLGLAGGHWLGGLYTALYGRIFRLPSLHHAMAWTSAAVAVAATGSAALGGALLAVWRAVRVPPAEALRPASPAVFRPLLLERLGLGAHLSTSARMVLRTLERRPGRTVAAVVGVGLAGALVIGGFQPWDAIGRVMALQYGRVERADLTVGFASARPVRAARELAALPGVACAEPFRATPARVARVGADGVRRERRLQLLGLEGTGTLRTLVDLRGAAHPLPRAGLVLPAGLASALAVRAGDTVEVALLEAGNARRAVVVAGVLDEMLGVAGYMERAALARLLREGDVASGAYLATAAGAEGAVSRRLKRVPGVAAVSSRAATIRSFEAQMAENLRVSGTVIVVAACVIAAGVIYNQARIALAERARELASLRVLGFTRQEVRRMLFGEQAAIALLGLPLGALLGAGFGMLFIRLFEAERHRFPYVADVRSFLFGAGVVVVATLVAAWPIRRRVDRLDLVAVLKTRE